MRCEGIVMGMIEEAIKNYWGERCPDHDADCVVCQAWEQWDFLKFEGYSIVKSPTGISIKPNNGDTNTEVCLRVEDGNLIVTLYATRSGADHWSEPIAQIQHSTHT